MEEEKPVYVCLVNGVVSRIGKYTGMCRHIGCGTNKCHHEGECQYKSVKQNWGEE